MRTFADTEVQARLIREMRELYEKRGKLESGIRAVDALTSASAHEPQVCRGIRIVRKV
jgi:hypothetical protein